MKTLILAAIRCSLIFMAVAALSVAYPASVQAVPTTYQYTGNPFTTVSGPYTTSDFVSGMLTLAGPLAPNMPLTTITPIAFSFSDGVQTLTNHTLNVVATFSTGTGPEGAVTLWDIQIRVPGQSRIETIRLPLAILDAGQLGGDSGFNFRNPGTWTTPATPDAGSSLALLSLSLTALGVAARRFQRGAT
jgi:hypothetical protein